MAGDPLLFFIALLVAEVLGTIGGFGSSMLVMPLAGWFMPFDQALGLTAVFHVLSNAAKMLLFRQGVSRHLLLWLGAPAVFAVIAGARLTVLMDDRISGLMLGTLLVVMGAGLLWRSQWRLQATRGNAMAGGVISGFIAGIAGTGGAVRGITLAAFDLEKMAFVSTSAWIDMGVDLSRSLVYASHGFVDIGILHYLPAMAVASFAGSWLGRVSLKHIPQREFRVVVLGMVVVMGIITLAQAWPA